ncbi:helix-turn-helix domain-containing protein [Streptomyces sp. TRM68367]|uniref:helix-turn-helix domain-containing protein n=1 Tax=Streptomyces sp. TRM68367 TaxID=2758415 RepID=UPI00165C2BA5|nr:helix-turn-helix domain-containing protein [Streptomyces sp. TRM68367]MBC9731084.1 helix-turn-helix domain-containing protein [Streptomyces sp. TRM68367]
MLRVHFGDADLARIRLSAAPDPLWEIAASLHRLQTRQGRWAYAEWYRTTRRQLREKRLERALRTVLLPLFPRAAYFPDFLTPIQTTDGLDAGLEAILATPPRRVLEEVTTLARVVGAPSWAPQLAELPTRKELVRVLRAYYEAIIAPYGELMQARVEAERAACCRGLMDGGVEGMLASLGPTMRWQRPVLHVDYHPTVDRDLRLDGRGMLFVPSYFNWQRPVSLADPELPPVLIYPLLHKPSAPPPGASGGSPAAPLTALLGRTRAAALCTAAAGATTGEIARAAGVSASAASRHATALRDAGLIASVRHGPTVLHTLTPTGASVLHAATRTPGG